MSDKQPDALRLAQAISGAQVRMSDMDAAAAELRRLHALNAELVEAVEAYLDAQGAVDNRELMGPNAPPYEELWRKRKGAYDDLDAALSKAKEQ